MLTARSKIGENLCGLATFNLGTCPDLSLPNALGADSEGSSDVPQRFAACPRVKNAAFCFIELAKVGRYYRRGRSYISLVSSALALVLRIFDS